MEKVSQGTVAGGRSAVQGHAMSSLRRMVALLLLAALAGVQAHESEQYTLPAGRDFADLGPQLSRAFLAAIHQAVADTNAAIDKALQDGALPSQLHKLQSADHIAGQVWGSIFNTYPTNELLDLELISPAMRSRYPGLVTMYRPVDSIYDDPLLMLDVSKPVRAFFRAGTVSAGGVLFGTDKIIHFINVGRIYHVRYLDAVERGLSEPDAALDAVQSTARNPLLSEDGLLGLYTTGIRSNGDLAADYAGLKFYRNLTEPVRIGGRLRPPMLQRDGPYWRVAVVDEDTVFSAFVSPHWNEVLNPNTYLGYVGDRVRSVIGTRCDDVADWYRDGRGQAHGAAWFAARQSELSTYFGEPYGHELEADDPVSVATICGPALAAQRRPPGRRCGGPRRCPRPRPTRWAAAPCGGPLPTATRPRSSAWRTAARRWMQPDLDGETPLHAAARQGHVPRRCSCCWRAAPMPTVPPATACRRCSWRWPAAMCRQPRCCCNRAPTRTRRTASAAPRCTRWRSAATCSWRCCCCSTAPTPRWPAAMAATRCRSHAAAAMTDLGGHAARLGPGGAQARPRRRRARQRPGGGVDRAMQGLGCVRAPWRRCA